MNITQSSTGEELEPIALAIHELLNRLPLTMRSKNLPGVRIEDGETVDHNYTGPILETVLIKGKTCRGIPKTGVYQGIPVVVVPLKENKEIICAIGVVDVTKGIYSDIMQITRRPEPKKPGNSKGDSY
jgi:hypothetical protein